MTTQKHPLNEEGEDHYMVMLNGGDENIQALLLNRESQDKQIPGSASRTDGRNTQEEHDFSGVIEANKKIGKMSFDAGIHNRPQTTVLGQKSDPYSSQSALGLNSESNKPEVSTHNRRDGYGGAADGTAFLDQDSTFF